MLKASSRERYDPSPVRVRLEESPSVARARVSEARESVLSFEVNAECEMERELRE